MQFLDLFSGLGGFRLALESIGYTCVGHVEKDKFVNKSYKEIHDDTNVWSAGDIQKVSNEELEQFVGKIDIIAGGFPCFSKGTLITTSEGYKNIEDIRKGDKVLTHTNSFKPVVLPMIKYKKGIFQLKIQGSPLNEVTEEHPYYAREMSRVWSKSKQNKERIWGEPKWINVGDLEKNKHYVGSPINKENSNIYELTKEECWLLGRYIADGYIKDGKRSGRDNSYNNIVTYCVGKHKIDTFKNNVSSYRIGISEERTAYKCRIINKRMVDLSSMCGRGAKNKVIPSFLLDLPIDLLEKVIDGYMSGDGYEKDGKFSANSISRELIYSLAQAIHKVFHTPCSIMFMKKSKTYVIEGRTVNQNDTWKINFKKYVGKQDTAKYIDGMIWYPVKSKEYLKDWEGNVYNFEVYEDNSYTSNNIAVHNCQPFANGGLKRGFGDTRGTVFFDVARFANIIKPKALFLENVKGLVNHDKGNTIDTIIRSLNEIGYIVDFNILNSKYFGVPQSRDRVYIIAIREDLIEESKWLKDSTRRVVPQAKKRIMKTYDDMRVFNFNYPKEECVTANLIELLECRKFEDNDFVFDSTKEALLSIAENGEVRIKEATHLGYAVAEKGDSINIGFPNSDSRRGRVGKGLARTLEAGGVVQGVLDFKSDGELSIRLLTSLESFRLQAFPDWTHDKADAVVGKSQMYKQIGNSVTINVIKEIGINLTKTIKNGEKLL